jgi:hypothetical protein
MARFPSLLRRVDTTLLVRHLAICAGAVAAYLVAANAFYPQLYDYLEQARMADFARAVVEIIDAGKSPGVDGRA